MTPEISELVERLESHMGKADVGDLLRDCRLAAEALRHISERIEDAERTLFKINSGEEFQSLMRLNNELLARLTEATEIIEDQISDAERQMKNPSHHTPFSMDKARRFLASVSGVKET